MNDTRISNRWAAALFGLCALALISCGGGVGSGGSGLASSASGTVSGFGSVIVDGARFDDSSAPTLREDEPGRNTITSAALGHQLTVDYDLDGVATGVRIDPTVVGAVTRVGSAGNIVVLGQAVSVNTDPLRGPVTQFDGGLAGLASVKLGQALEVHGVLVGSKSDYTVQATRIVLLSALPTFVKATGIASALGPNRFTLAGLQVDTTGATVLPSGGQVMAGQPVSVLAAQHAASPSIEPLRLVVSQVRIGKSGAEGESRAIGGVIDSIDLANKIFYLGGVKVGYSGAALSPATADLVNGLYVRAKGRVAVDGTLQASSIVVRDGRDSPEAELKGNITGFNAASKTFVVRETAVDASTATLESCPATGLANGLYVQVEGALGSNGLIAKKVQCTAESAGATVERVGVAGTVDAAASSFVLTPASGPTQKVRWTTNTFFSNTTAGALPGLKVQVQGKLVDGVLVAQKIEPN
jgi:Domain of unknown function (DUF5666)